MARVTSATFCKNTIWELGGTQIVGKFFSQPQALQLLTSWTRKSFNRRPPNSAVPFSCIHLSVVYVFEKFQMVELCHIGVVSLVVTFYLLTLWFNDRRCLWTQFLRVTSAGSLSIKYGESWITMFGMADPQKSPMGTYVWPWICMISSSTSQTRSDPIMLKSVLAILSG